MRIIICSVRPTAIDEEHDAPDIDRRRQRASGLRRNEAVQEIDVDVPRAADGGGNAHEHRADQQVARDLLGPCRRVVQHVAGEELVEDVEAQQPEEGERSPILEQVVGQVDRRVLDVEMTLGVEDVFGVALVIAWTPS